MIPSEITIIGLGNVLMQDEGIGVYIANLLHDKYTFLPSITIIDGGTTGIDLLPYFETSKRILLIDAVDFERKPGYFAIIKDDEILTMLTSKLSLHHLGLSDVLSMIKILDIRPESIFLVGIQPHLLELDLDISPQLKKYINSIIKEVLTILREWNISCMENKSH